MMDIPVLVMAVAFCAFVGLAIYDKCQRQRVRRENARRQLAWRVALDAARRNGDAPPPPPNMLEWR